MEIDLDKVLENAVHHMDSDVDVHWTIGMALVELYPKQILKLQESMVQKYNERLKDMYNVRHNNQEK
jgi:hypothetical protein